MPNPEGRVAFSCELEFDEDSSLKSGRFDLTLKMTNSGRRAMEDFLDLEYPQIDARLSSSGGLGNRMMTALFIGATRKYHARRFSSYAHADEFMDAVDDSEDEDLKANLLIALLSANARVSMKEMRSRLGLDENNDPVEPVPDTEDEPDKSEGEDENPTEGTPEGEPKKPAASKGRAASGRGKNSSQKQSAAV